MSLVDSERVCALWTDAEFTICRVTDVGVWGPAGSKGSGRRAPSVWRFLQFFNENNTLLGIFRLKFLLKNIFLFFFQLYKTVNDLETEHFFSLTKIHDEK